MLVLARKEREAIEFPELGVVIRVVSLKKTKVQLGIEAPQRIKVVRSEVRDAGSREAVASSSRPTEFSPMSPKRRFDSGRFARELGRLEAQISALAELASESNRHLARQVVDDAQCQFQRLERLLVSVVDLPTDDDLASEPKAPAFATSRLDHDSASASLRYAVAAAADDACVRQRQAEFTITTDPPRFDSGYHVANGREYYRQRVVWFPTGLGGR